VIGTADSDSGFFADREATKFLDGEATKSEDWFQVVKRAGVGALNDRLELRRPRPIVTESFRGKNGRRIQIGDWKCPKQSAHSALSD
jgi:hypothetical protein